MNVFHQKAVATAMCLALGACSTLQVVSDGRDAARTFAALKALDLTPGDPLELTLSDGKHQHMRFGKLEETALIGDIGGVSERVELAQISHVERNGIDRNKSEMIGTAGLALLAVVLVALGFNSVFHVY